MPFEQRIFNNEDEKWIIKFSQASKWMLASTNEWKKENYNVPKTETMILYIFIQYISYKISTDKNEYEFRDRNKKVKCFWSICSISKISNRKLGKLRKFLENEKDFFPGLWTFLQQH